jgi:hypothetical protein
MRRAETQKKDWNNLTDESAADPEGVAEQDTSRRSGTTRRRDIIGRRISKGDSPFPVLRAVDRRKDRASLSLSLSDTPATA